MRRRGFTLLELMFVITIIATLAAILFPVFAGARESARRSVCASNLMQVGAALNMYAQNYDGRYPKKNNDFGPLYSYAKCIDVFYCPSDPTERLQLAYGAKSPRGPINTSYVYRGGLTSDDRGDKVIAGEAQIWHGNVANALHVGGYVRGVPAEVYSPAVSPAPKRKNQPPSAPPPGAAPAPGP